MNINPKISIITPVKNSEKYIEITIKSVLNLIKNDIKIEYIIIDGLSTDNTLNIIEKYKSHIDIVISENDNSMFDALCKGIKIAKGDYICYINAGDILFPTAICSIKPYIDLNYSWIMCRKVLINDDNMVISDILPCKFFKTNILCGLNAGMLEYIQQESTIFKKSLLTSNDLLLLSKFKYSGDYYIWQVIAKHGVKPIIIDTLFGGFRKHEFQLSSNKKRYRSEIIKFEKIGLKTLLFYMISLTMICTYRFILKLYETINNIKKLK